MGWPMLAMGAVATPSIAVQEHFPDSPEGWLMDRELHLAQAVSEEDALTETELRQRVQE
jgi:hypothetical protein